MSKRRTFLGASLAGTVVAALPAIAREAKSAR